MDVYQTIHEINCYGSVCNNKQTKMGILVIQLFHVDMKNWFTGKTHYTTENFSITIIFSCVLNNLNFYRLVALTGPLGSLFLLSFSKVPCPSLFPSTFPFFKSLITKCYYIVLGRFLLRTPNPPPRHLVWQSCLLHSLYMTKPSQ